MMRVRALVRGGALTVALTAACSDASDPANIAPPDATGGAPGDSMDETCEHEYRAGHGDLFVAIDDGLVLKVRSAFDSGVPETLVDPAAVCVVVPRAAYELAEDMGGAPDSADYAFLGAAPGQAFWLLPQSPRQGLPWFGASTEAVPSAVYTGDSVDVVLAAVEMPANGSFSAWSAGTFGKPSPIFSTATEVRSHSFPTGVHVHFNWAFSAPGKYVVSFQATARLGQATEASPSVPLRFLVQP